MGHAVTVGLIAIVLACSHLGHATPPASPPPIEIRHPTAEELAGASVALADICLGILDHGAPEVTKITELLQRCVDQGTPEEDGPESCAHFACNRIRRGKLLDYCGPREHHGPWIDRTSY